LLDGAGCKWPFELVTSERVYYIEAETLASRSEWIEVLEGTIALFKPKTELVVVSDSSTTLWLLVRLLTVSCRVSSQRKDFSKNAEVVTRAGSGGSLSSTVSLDLFLLGRLEFSFISPRLIESRVKYFKDEKSTKPLGVIDLGLCRGIRKVPSGKNNRFVHGIFCLFVCFFTFSSTFITGPFPSSLSPRTEPIQWLLNPPRKCRAGLRPLLMGFPMIRHPRDRRRT